MSVGLVYAKTAHRHMAEVLLGEIGRPPGPEMENSIDRESYSLAAGLALGFVTLGKGLLLLLSLVVEFNGMVTRFCRQWPS